MLFRSGNAHIRVVPRPKKDDSAEVYIGEEFIGVLFVDDEDDDKSYNFQMAILDVDLEDLGGFALLSSIVNDSDVPVIVLTERGEEPLRLLGFELGADDYIVKPCSSLELASRMRTVMRRIDGRRRPTGAVVSGDLVLDLEAREATRGGEPVALTAKEFDLLAYLVAHQIGRAHV